MIGRALVTVALLAAPAAAQVTVGGVELHGFVSQGAFVSTANDYLGRSSRGSLELFEVGLNASTQLTDRLRAGVQLFARDIGFFDDSSPRVDWAFVDYRWQPWLGVRAGIIKMPYGLYNEFADIDAGRLPILMPQAVYPVRNRDVLLAHRGFTLYGTRRLGGAGALDYQVWLGTLSIPENALILDGVTLDRIDTKYVTGAQLFWTTPVEGLRVGATALRAVIDFELTFSAENVAALIEAGLVPEDYDGALLISQDPTTWVIGSIELLRGDWLLAAEYGRAFKHQEASLPQVVPTIDEDSERFYALVGYRLGEALEVGAYYSVLHLDAGDRTGEDERWTEPFHAFQRDLAATLRWDVNPHWLWKLEAHLIDGTADLPTAVAPERTWGLFLLRTTVSF